MSIDNPLDQVELMIASDKRQDPPKPVEDILNAISKIPIPGLSYFVSAPKAAFAQTCRKKMPRFSSQSFPVLLISEQNLRFPVHLFSGEGFVSRGGCRGRLD
jgi:hypothetical protein